MAPRRGDVVERTAVENAQLEVGLGVAGVEREDFLELRSGFLEPLHPAQQ